LEISGVGFLNGAEPEEKSDADWRQASAARPAPHYRRTALQFTNGRPYADPEAAARRIMKIAFTVEAVQGRIHLEKITRPFLFHDEGTPAEYRAGLKRAIDNGWLKLHDSGTFVTFTPAGADLFA
jgi:hypothetical protein